jgi:hypothetical protein
MKKLLLSSLLVLLAAAPVHAGFDEVVAHVAKNSGLKRTSLPFMGLARFAVWVASPDGVHDFQIAVFEGAAGTSRGELSAQAISAAAGKGWKPFVQSRSKSETTVIYAQPDGNLMRLLIVTQEKDEAAVIEVKLDADKVAEFINDNDENRGGK